MLPVQTPSPLWAIGFLLVAVVGGLAIAALSFCFAHDGTRQKILACKLFSKTKSSEEDSDSTSAETVNQIVTTTFSIVVTLVYSSFIIAGLVAIPFGLYWFPWYWGALSGFLGICLTAAGTALLVAGYEKLDSTEGGVATIFGSNILRFGKNDYTFTFRGFAMTIPFLIGIRRVQLESVEWVFPMKLISTEIEKDSSGKPLGLETEGEAEMTMAPDPCDMYDFIMMGGNMDELRKKSSGIVFRVVSQKATTYVHSDGRVGLTQRELTQRGDYLSTELEKQVNGFDSRKGLFEERDFGIKSKGKKVQVKFRLPADIVKKMAEIKTAQLEAEAQLQSTQGDIKSVELIAGSLSVPRAAAWDRMMQAEQMRLGQLDRVQVESISTGQGGGTLNINEVHVHMGNKKQKGSNN